MTAFWRLTYLQILFFTCVVLTSFAVAAPSNFLYVAREMKSSPSYFFPIALNRSSDHTQPVYVIIQGIDFGEAENWVNVLKVANQTKSPVYFLKIDQHLNAYTNQLRIEDSVAELVAKYGTHRKIHLVAFSTGGVLALMVWDKLTQTYPDNLHLTTVASPVAGYAPPVFVYPLVRLFAGPLATFVAYGIDHWIDGKDFKNCSHIINTDCSLDQHACPHKWRGKTIKNSQEVNAMPCSSIEYIQKGHLEALEYAVHKILL